MRSLIVHNLASGFGSSAIFEFMRELIGPSDECLVRTLGEGILVEDLLADAEEFDLVVISGGDGTVAGALYALRDRGVPTCVFPSGTANLLFNNLGCAPEPTAIAAACAAGATRRLDLGELSLADEAGGAASHGFAIMAGMGFDAELMATAAADKRTLGEAAYFTAVLANLRPSVSSFEVTVDGITHRCKGISCIVANTARIQGDIDLLPGCSMDDGQLDVMVLTTTDAVQLLRPIVAGLIDPVGDLIGRPGIKRFRGASIHVQSSVPLPVQCDGDPLDATVTSYEARCLPEANLIVIDPHSPYYA